ncbi:MAG: ATP-grasp domain-containing protein [Flavobacteriales bacterium]
MKKLLLSGLGGSLFPYLHEQLKASYELFYVDNQEELKYIYPDYNFFPAPLVKHADYLPFVKKLIREKGIEVYIPLIDEEIELALELEKDFPQLVVLSPKKEFVELCLNKYNLMHSLEKHGISSIATVRGDEFNGQISYPLFVKPIFGRGSRGIAEIYNAQELESYYQSEPYKPSEVLVQPLIKGQEYTVGVLVNPVNKILCLASRCVISKKGITQSAYSTNVGEIDEVVYKINEIYTPGGPYNVQLFVDQNNKVHIFEINPRFSTTSIMSYAGGVNEIQLYLNNLQNKEIAEVRPKANIYLKRMWNNMFYEK